MKLSVVTLNYKTPDLTLACIDSVYRQFSEEFGNDEIEHIIVDNLSGDDSVEKIEKPSNSVHIEMSDLSKIPKMLVLAKDVI
ncbi:MAG: hypothetical protein KGL95_07735 [Patescibacteria group bacterium]|nr:hypothetical protein [Patescibacteria group bacterium]